MSTRTRECANETVKVVEIVTDNLHEVYLEVAALIVEYGAAFVNGPDVQHREKADGSGLYYVAAVDLHI